MRHRAFSRGGAALIGLSVAIWGCNQNSPTRDKPRVQAAGSKPKPLKYEVKVEPRLETPPAAQHAEEPAETSPASEPPRDASVATPPLPFADPHASQLTMPQVVLSQAHAQTCLVGVDGELPDLQLVDLQGAPQSLKPLLGKKLTVVVFWNGAQPSALQELADLGPDVAERFSSNGVAVVGVNAGDNPESARELAKAANVRFALLDDPTSAAFGQIATKKIPRTYLVDATGKIAWLDIEYSRTTRRELTQAIRFLLSHDPAAAPRSP